MLTSASPPTIRLPSTKCFVVKPARFYLEFVWAHSGGNGCFINRPGLHGSERCEILQMLCSGPEPQEPNNTSRTAISLCSGEIVFAESKTSLNNIYFPQNKHRRVRLSSAPRVQICWHVCFLSERNLGASNGTRAFGINQFGLLVSIFN